MTVGNGRNKKSMTRGTLKIIAMSAEVTGTIEADSCDLPILNFKYCPHCGAEMDIKEE